jgi:methylenetetrahydrofolate reductase (NADPH)
MPVTTIHGIERMTTMGAAVPSALVERLLAADKQGGAPAVRAEGIRAAIALCRELLDEHAPGLHFYTLNRSNATSKIYYALFE